MGERQTQNERPLLRAVLVLLPVRQQPVREVAVVLRPSGGPRAHRRDGGASGRQPIDLTHADSARSPMGGGRPAWRRPARPLTDRARSTPRPRPPRKAAQDYVHQPRRHWVPSKSAVLVRTRRDYGR